jgi:UV DNA damage repair endonuclease
MNHKPQHLGLVCITASDKVRFRSLTRKRLLQQTTEEQERLLRELYTDNIQRLQQAIAFCDSEDIRLYRLTSALFPFADEPIGAAVLDEFASIMLEIGTNAQLLGIRYEDPSIADMVSQSRSTWQVPEWQLVHISNGSTSFLDPKHSDLITAMPSAYRSIPWIEVEAKHKELAIAFLRETWQ